MICLVLDLFVVVFVNVFGFCENFICSGLLARETSELLQRNCGGCRVVSDVPVNYGSGQE